MICTVSIKAFSQKDSTAVKGVKVKGKIEVTDDFYNPLSPSKAAFYSAIFPGMGQIYNKKYWKAPIVWGAMGTSIYFYLDNNSEYKRFRRAFKQRKAGLQDEFTLDDGSQLISEDGLVNAQNILRQNRDLSLLATIVLYTLQIVEASVNAHLMQFNTNDNLSFKPVIIQDPSMVYAPTLGMSFKLTF
ncbi:DUF5683 domain-containing protein [Flavobacteriaceae bacterium S356]|uniref:DUF5683 domain-containing protein n=1 Tax=Asprobacillus argus TaxID=3076534 RepID=A0ABU3LJ78_9FLAO|nr:DUF5683 domain-containing protein [Flavobacteriaceae bacterium S356]